MLVKKKLNSLLNLQNQYNVKDSITLANDLINLKIDANHRLTTFDIKDLYVNIPIRETLRIAKKYLSRDNDDKLTTEQIITLLQVILQQNYISSDNCIYQSEKGVSMGSPLSGTVAEILLQDLENTYIKHLLDAPSTRDTWTTYF